MSAALAGGFLTSEPPGEVTEWCMSWTLRNMEMSKQAQSLLLEFTLFCSDLDKSSES